MVERSTTDGLCLPVVGGHEARSFDDLPVVSRELVAHLKLGDSIRFRPADVMTSLNAHSKPGRVQRVPAVEV
jgi:hypothetical protein